MELGTAAFVDKPLTTGKLAERLKRFSGGRAMSKTEAPPTR